MSRMQMLYLKNNAGSKFRIKEKEAHHPMKKIPMLAMMIAPYFLLWVYVSQNFDLLPVSFGLFGAVMFFGAIYAFFCREEDSAGNRSFFGGCC